MTSELSSSVLVDQLRQKHALTTEEIKKHTLTFDLYDKNNNGRVSMAELAREVDAQAQFFKDKTLSDGLRHIYLGRLRKFCKKGDDCLSYSEFINCKQYGKFADGFRSLRYKGDYRGYVEPQELKAYLSSKMKDELNEEIIDHVLNTMVVDHQGKLTFQDFMDGLIFFILQSESDHKRPPQINTSPGRTHLKDELILQRLRAMFVLSEAEQKQHIDHFKAVDTRGVGSVTFSQFLALDAPSGETAAQLEQRQQRIQRLVQLCRVNADKSRFSVDDFLTLKKANKVFDCLVEQAASDGEYVLEKEKLRKYVHKKIWLRGVDGRFLDELLETMGVSNDISIDDFAVALSVVVFPFGK